MGMGIVMGVALGVIGTVVGLGGVALVAFCSGCRLKCGDVFERKHVYATMEDNGAGATTPGHFRKPGPPVILPNEVKSGSSCLLNGSSNGTSGEDNRISPCGVGKGKRGPPRGSGPTESAP